MASWRDPRASAGVYASPVTPPRSAVLAQLAAARQTPTRSPRRGLSFTSHAPLRHADSGSSSEEFASVLVRMRALVTALQTGMPAATSFDVQLQPPSPLSAREESTVGFGSSSDEGSVRSGGDGWLASSDGVFVDDASAIAAVCEHVTSGRAADQALVGDIMTLLWLVERGRASQGRAGIMVEVPDDVTDAVLAALCGCSVSLAPTFAATCRAVYSLFGAGCAGAPYAPLLLAGGATAALAQLLVQHAADAHAAMHACRAMHTLVAAHGPIPQQYTAEPLRVGAGRALAAVGRAVSLHGGVCREVARWGCLVLAAFCRPDWWVGASDDADCAGAVAAEGDDDAAATAAAAGPTSDHHAPAGAAGGGGGGWSALCAAVLPWRWRGGRTGSTPLSSGGGSGGGGDCPDGGGVEAVVDVPGLLPAVAAALRHDHGAPASALRDGTGEFDDGAATISGGASVAASMFFPASEYDDASGRKGDAPAVASAPVAAAQLLTALCRSSAGRRAMAATAGSGDGTSAGALPRAPGGDASGGASAASAVLRAYRDALAGLAAYAPASTGIDMGMDASVLMGMDASGMQGPGGEGEGPGGEGDDHPYHAAAAASSSSSGWRRGGGTSGGGGGSSHTLHHHHHPAHGGREALAALGGRTAAIGSGDAAALVRMCEACSAALAALAGDAATRAQLLAGGVAAAVSTSLQQASQQEGRPRTGALALALASHADALPSLVSSGAPRHLVRAIHAATGRDRAALCDAARALGTGSATGASALAREHVLRMLTRVRADHRARILQWGPSDVDYAVHAAATRAYDDLVPWTGEPHHNAGLRTRAALLLLAACGVAAAALLRRWWRGR